MYCTCVYDQMRSRQGYIKTYALFGHKPAMEQMVTHGPRIEYSHSHNCHEFRRLCKRASHNHNNTYLYVLSDRISLFGLRVSTKVLPAWPYLFPLGLIHADESLLVRLCGHANDHWPLDPLITGTSAFL